ncbi:MAG: alpha-glycosidase [Oscillospiraceae bacterium]|nr:alpha-glycosidase [Oscillospiraceae bacterium]
MDSTLLSGIHSDETSVFRNPTEPEKGDTITIKIRVPLNAANRVALMMGEPSAAILMHKYESDAYFDWYQTKIICQDSKVSYYFRLEMGSEKIAFTRAGAQQLSADEAPDSSSWFRFTPGFHVPGWAKGAIQYQIMTDRFCNGDKSNDVENGEYYYVNRHSRRMPKWDSPVEELDIANFYGGDLQGVMQKLDYLQDLGVEVIYFNPLFVSPSSHKYDTQDYDHIDPHFAVIEDDEDHRMQGWEKHNGYAPRYIRRTTSAVNLLASDRYFATFCQEVHRRGMHIILDGVFNHCGSFNKWMDREGIYVGSSNYEKGAYQDVFSPYRSFFNFNELGHGRYAQYEGWWGYETLPKLNYEGSKELQERVYAIAEKWARPPYSIDGWRLDVAADLGHTDEFNHEFWKEFRRRVKKVNPDLIIIAEHYGDASPWLQGDQWDTVMNYDAFMEPLTYFLTGMEKHSDAFREDLYQNGEAFFRTILKNMANFQQPSLAAAMNELSNHDHSRFLTRTNRKVGRLPTAGSAAAGEGISKAVFREAVTVQMTWPGAPTIYYGDEAGQVGWTDPDCRRTYPWGKEDQELIALHRDLIRLRKQNEVLKKGSLKPLAAERGVIAYGRFDTSAVAVICLNNTEAEQKLSLNVRAAGAGDKDEFRCVFRSGAEGHDLPQNESAASQNGRLELTLQPLSAVIYIRK